MLTQYYKYYFSYQHYVDNIKKLEPSAEIVRAELKYLSHHILPKSVYYTCHCVRFTLTLLNGKTPSTGICAVLWLTDSDPAFTQWLSNCQTVLRIHDILVWIRIRGSMPLTNGSRSGSFYFRQKLSRCQQKTNFLKKFFCILLFEGTVTSFSKGKKVKRSHKTVEIKAFLTILASY